MNLISGIASSASALSAQRTRLDVIAQNIANANTTRGPDGLPYQRHTVSFEAAMLDAAKGPAGMYAVRVAEIATDRTPGQRINDPGHPDADAEGMVTLSNVNLSMEMVDLIAASRAYEANLSVVRSSRQMALKTLEIGK